jgi:DNA-binding transcriptional regulator YhcF (GntR family)
MEIVLSRRGGVPVRDQLVAQLELKILSGQLAPAQRLPSVRALARRLEIHPNTVSAAYQDLEAAGRVRLRKGSGVFVRAGGPTAVPDAGSLDGMIRLALHAAFRKGYSGVHIRAAVERWLRAVPPERVVVVDSSREMAELLAHELRLAIPVSHVAHCSLEDLGREPGLLAGALALCLPYHVLSIAQVCPDAAVEVVNLEVQPADRAAILDLPAGAVVLVVTHSPRVVQFASILLRSLRGDEVLVEAHLLSAVREWGRLLPAADLVFADVLSAESVKRLKPRRLREVRILNDQVVTRLRDALTVVVPFVEASARAESRGPS